jgi:hypothetical protein
MTTMVFEVWALRGGAPVSDSTHGAEIDALKRLGELTRAGVPAVAVRDGVMVGASGVTTRSDAARLASAIAQQPRQGAAVASGEPCPIPGCVHHAAPAQERLAAALRPLCRGHRGEAQGFRVGRTARSAEEAVRRVAERAVSGDRVSSAPRAGGAL